MPTLRPQPLPFADPGDIRRLRTTIGLTQEQLAEQMQVTPMTVGRWEAGQSNPRSIYLRQLRELEAAAAAVSAVQGPQAAQQIDATPPQLDFAGDPQAVSVVAEAWHLAYGHQFNPTFASEISRIDPLPHQRIAVYEHMLRQDPLRFLLADDAGAGKTIMTGLTVREMLLRGRVRRVLVVPPAGLVGNWQRELQTLFRLSFRIVTGAEARGANPFRGPGSDLAIVSIDTLAGPTFDRLCEPDTPPYDLVVFDEAHKLSASTNQRRPNAPHKSQRYQLAEGITGCAAPSSSYSSLPWACRHLLLLTATPHMGHDSPYHHLWRLLDPHVFATGEAFRRFPENERSRHFLRRTKEEMVDLQGNPLYPPRECSTFSYQLSEGPNGEQALYDDTTQYLLNAYSAMDNEGAMRLALGVFQRRLASSAFALSRSLERRIDRLRETARQLASGELTPHDVQLGQQKLRRNHAVDHFEQHTADEDGSGTGSEANEDYETAILGAIVTVSVEALEQEIKTLTRLNQRAKAILDSGSESKFEKLRQVLEDPSHSSEKWIIFTEHRDTMDYLVRRLEGLGYTGEVAQIHGGMAWPEREEQVEAFRRQDGARYLVATDAAGEGINLQFCAYMANYDIPWNPARLEQRMGRIHRYGQSRKVHIANLVAASTREGRVLEVLLDKLDTIREELKSDKVFDVIGRMFENASLRDVMVEALKDEDAAKARLDRLAAKENVTAIREQEAAAYGKTGDVASRLTGLRSDMDRERYLQLLPAQVRRFVSHSAALLDIDIRGDINDVFSLAPLRPGAMDPLLPALATYPAMSRNRLSTQRTSTQDGSLWVHPGEPVFEALAHEVIRRFGPDALRGTILVDPKASEAYMLHVALSSVEIAGDSPTQDIPTKQTLERRLLAVRQQADGTSEATDIEPLLLLHGSRRVAPGSVPLASRGVGLKAGAGEFLQQHAEANLAGEHRNSLRLELPERRRRVAAGFDLQLSELTQSRRNLRKRTVNEDRAEAHEASLEAIKEAQQAVRMERALALANLEVGHEHIGTRDVRFLAHVLVVPATTEDDVAQYDESVEEFAVRVATEWERQRGHDVRDVSKPALARDAGLPDYPGFDLQARFSDGRKRAIEVKGRGGKDAIQMEWNEWKQACNLGEEYWLYVVLDCATPSPQLIRIQDPFRKLLTKQQETATYSISAKSLIAAAETDWQEPGSHPTMYTRRTVATVGGGQ